jgi:hypothetical protein
MRLVVHDKWYQEHEDDDKEHCKEGCKLGKDRVDYHIELGVISEHSEEIYNSRYE